MRKWMWFSMVVLLSYANAPAQELVGGVPADGSEVWAQAQAAADEAFSADLAEQIVDLRESSTGRAFDSAYKVRQVFSLQNGSVEELEALIDSGGYAATDLAAPAAFGSPAVDLVYTPVIPCRIIDTRLAGGIMAADSTRDFLVAGTTGFAGQGGLSGGCGVPLGPATAAIINFTAVTPTGAGNLRAFAWATPPPTAPTAVVQNYGAVVGQVAFNNGTAVPLCDLSAGTCTFDLIIQNDVSQTHVVADVVGYFSAIPTPNTTFLVYSGTTSDSTVSGTYEFFRTISNFTKLFVNTTITTTWRSHVDQTGTIGSTFCHFQVRIDNVMPAGAGNWPGVVVYGDDQAVENTDYWTGLSAGTHTVSLWPRGSASTCLEDKGNFSPSVLVVEQ